ncbi:hypothetical protein FACS18949_02960 [Clostridia bacterium]|nr:hypothetical protein FACS18949_02960 [Clostridia bacterium]
MEIAEIMANVKQLQEDMRHTKESREKIYERLNELERSSAVFSATLSRIETEITKVGVKIDELAQKPAKRWDDLVRQIIGLAVAAVIGGILAKLI